MKWSSLQKRAHLFQICFIVQAPVHYSHLLQGQLFSISIGVPVSIGDNKDDCDVNEVNGQVSQELLHLLQTTS